ncbi:MAG: ATP-binding protein [Pseudomonadota bacterium]
MNSILWKFLTINVFIVAAVMLLVWLTFDYLAADYFSVLMEQYNLDSAETNQMFLDSVHRYLINASLGGIVLAVLVGLYFTRRILRPLSHVTAVTRKVASGDYKARVGLEGMDEVGQLARAFDRMADSLERVESLRQSMVTDVSHELRTPLTNIRGYLEGMADGVVKPNKETHEMLQREILRLVRLVEDLGRLAKADAAAMGLNHQLVNLEDLVAEVAALDEGRAARQKLESKWDFAADAKSVLADRDKLLQVIHNVMDNAWRYANQGSLVEVKARRQMSEIVVTVSNQGRGIAQDDLPFIFERFYRADKSRSRQSGGAGIGLAIVKELVEAHGGTVGADCQNGRTSIWFSLPAA